MLKWRRVEQRSTFDLVRPLDLWPGAPWLRQVMRDLPETSVYLAGGAVRDVLRGAVKPRDFDIFVDGSEFSEFVRRLSKQGAIEFGPFGSPRWYPNAGGIYADVISVERFDNGVERCSNIDDVLRQFDFTANAVAVNLRTLALHDPVGGVDDGRKGIMRCIRFDYPDEPIGPQQVLSRNEVLWIRLVHYAGTLGLIPERTTKKWLAENSHFARAAPLFSSRFFPPLFEVLH